MPARWFVYLSAKGDRSPIAPKYGLLSKYLVGGAKGSRTPDLLNAIQALIDCIPGRCSCPAGLARAETGLLPISAVAVAIRPRETGSPLTAFVPMIMHDHPGG